MTTTYLCSLLLDCMEERHRKIQFYLFRTSLTELCFTESHVMKTCQGALYYIPWRSALELLLQHRWLPWLLQWPHTTQSEQKLAWLTAGWRVLCSSHHLFLRIPGCPAYRSTQLPPGWDWLQIGYKSAAHVHDEFQTLRGLEEHFISHALEPSHFCARAIYFSVAQLNGNTFLILQWNRRTRIKLSICLSEHKWTSRGR